MYEHANPLARFVELILLMLTALKPLYIKQYALKIWRLSNIFKQRYIARLQ